MGTGTKGYIEVLTEAMKQQASEAIQQAKETEDKPIKIQIVDENNQPYTVSDLQNVYKKMLQDFEKLLKDSGLYEIEDIDQIITLHESNLQQDLKAYEQAKKVLTQDISEKFTNLVSVIGTTPVEVHDTETTITFTSKLMPIFSMLNVLFTEYGITSDVREYLRNESEWDILKTLFDIRDEVIQSEKVGPVLRDALRLADQMSRALCVDILFRLIQLSDIHEVKTIQPVIKVTKEDGNEITRPFNYDAIDEIMLKMNGSFILYVVSFLS